MLPRPQVSLGGYGCCLTVHGNVKDWAVGVLTHAQPTRSARAGLPMLIRRLFSRSPLSVLYLLRKRFAAHVSAVALALRN